MEKLVDWFQIDHSVKITKAVRMTRWDKVLKNRVPMKMILLDGESHEGFKIVLREARSNLDVKCFHLRCSSQDKDFHLVAASANAWDMRPSSAKEMRHACDALRR